MTGSRRADVMTRVSGSGHSMTRPAGSTCERGGGTPPGGESAREALDLIRAGSAVYHEARWYGVQRAMRARASDWEIALALGMSISATRERIDRIRTRERELGPDAEGRAAAPRRR
ncbi:hypothetical protein [Streptomyces globisporus]|uniref:hypothetical protein n=1 Tax=Streptomyces globisporus TaxID=1908 RepID=UPI00345F6352|nr:hypothetical protein OG215_00350 [Streptomyces globisporus]